MVQLRLNGHASVSNGGSASIISTKNMFYTRRLSSYSFVGCAHSPQSHS
ncbi:hypothetical protein XNC1_2452 [Xenorhabdus nematophila ATCC 19061]|uniref:Uncharacterized protein n=2 Tax=Xenorhabdus nematophila TaxID=628 RepID=D3VGS5_XENNA|nr:hypothetical protein XNC1_2452 [Xenorhabdus nematophila ATCC 19061]CEF31704.1 hypothetical protein XNW1_3960005 [Xenorhabdus nematophila str. Websteri]CEF34170.1 hypothetical protein XNW1_850005 [Xenorhabdus nematophila str. Websteri]CEK23353.1 hypothetical protein XNC2_2359 [Xenorhabdus nematophila AN6/1]SOV25632.1 conserved hypothetical protein in Xenorhabdus and Photorhabdus genera [Xenorhabdus nematophila]